jgi:hypothetical protein
MRIILCRSLFADFIRTECALYKYTYFISLFQMPDFLRVLQKADIHESYIRFPVVFELSPIYFSPSFLEIVKHRTTLNNFLLPPSSDFMRQE